MLPLQFPHSRGNCVIQALQDPRVGSARTLRLLGLPISIRQQLQEQGSPGLLQAGQEHSHSPSFPPAAVPSCCYVTQEGCASSSRLKERLASVAGLLASL